MPTFLVVPQWQGSSSARAMRLVDGAEAIRGDLPSASTRVVEVPTSAGDDRGSGVARLSSIALVRERALEAMDGAPEPVITIGGDCSAELAGLTRSAQRGAAVVYFDAHPDIHSPATSTSKAFHGMVLRTVLGDGPAELVPDVPLPPEHLILAGVRAPDPAEADYLASAPIVSLREPTPESVVAAVTATGAGSVHIHIDLDVLDPSEVEGMGFPEPFGMSATGLVACINALLERWPLAGAGVLEFAPASPQDAVNDLPTILRLIGALSKGRPAVVAAS